MSELIALPDALGGIATARRFEPAANAEAEPDSPRAIRATPFVWTDPTKIPPRAWIYAQHYARQFISTTVAPSGVGKSSLAIAELLAITTGRPLLGVAPAEVVNAWLWNGEDPRDELQRRIAAAVLHYEIDPKELAGTLFLDSGRELKIIVAEQARSGTVIARPVVDALIKTIRENRIGVLVVDPFVASHRVVENDNGAIEAVMAEYAGIADAAGCAIELVHHVRKTGGVAVTVDDGRGASAMLAKARSARALNQMSEDEGAKAGVANRRLYFRADNGKASMSVPPDKASWFHLASVDLGNGDNVGVATAWTWPDALADVTVEHLRAVQTAVADGHWRENSQSKDWIGYAVAKVCGLDPLKKPEKAKIASMVKIWIGTGMLAIASGKDGKGMDRTFVEVGTWADD